MGLVLAGICVIYDIYQLNSTLAALNSYTQQLSQIRKEIKSLDSEKDCARIAELERQAINLSLKISKEYLTGTISGIGTAALCIGLAVL